MEITEQITGHTIYCIVEQRIPEIISALWMKFEPLRFLVYVK